MITWIKSAYYYVRNKLFPLRPAGGCGTCCTPVPLSIHEAQVIADSLDEPIDRLFDRPPRSEDLYTKATITDNRDGTISRRCAFFTTDSLCSIYELRPTICRRFVCPDCDNGERQES